ncbi:MAG: hypothetical protein QXT13_05075 [Pyrobaculum sp.]
MAIAAYQAKLTALVTPRSEAPARHGGTIGVAITRDVTAGVEYRCVEAAPIATAWGVGGRSYGI